MVFLVRFLSMRAVFLGLTGLCAYKGIWNPGPSRLKPQSINNENSHSALFEPSMSGVLEFGCLDPPTARNPQCLESDPHRSNLCSSALSLSLSLSRREALSPFVSATLRYFMAPGILQSETCANFASWRCESQGESQSELRCEFLRSAVACFGRFK